jgi:hypothetical protein
MLASAFVLAALAVPHVLELYFNTRNELNEEEYIPDGR